MEKFKIELWAGCWEEQATDLTFEELKQELKEIFESDRLFAKQEGWDEDEDPFEYQVSKYYEDTQEYERIASVTMDFEDYLDEIKDGTREDPVLLAHIGTNRNK